MLAVYAPFANQPLNFITVSIGWLAVSKSPAYNGSICDYAVDGLFIMNSSVPPQRSIFPFGGFFHLVADFNCCSLPSRCKSESCFALLVLLRACANATSRRLPDSRRGIAPCAAHFSAFVDSLLRFESGPCGCAPFRFLICEAA